MTCRGRIRRHALIDVSAYCADCDWTAETKNAHGLGAQHHDRYDHDVRVNQTHVFRYARPDADGPDEEKARA
jgi:hypothetical protein